MDSKRVRVIALLCSLALIAAPVLADDRRPSAQSSVSEFPVFSALTAGKPISEAQVQSWIRTAERFNDGEFERNSVEVRASSERVDVRLPLPNDTESCCSTWQGFDLTGVLSVSPTNTSGGSACSNCVPGLDPLNIGMNYPFGFANVGGTWSTTMTFISQIPGPCVAAFLWVDASSGQTIAGAGADIADCGASNVWLVEFTNIVVPNLPGDTVAVGIIQASSGVVDVDFEQFLIQ